MGNGTEYVKGRKIVDKTATFRAPAKINLHLEVLRRRHDGYHDIETILQAVALYDEVQVTLREQYPGGEPNIQMSVDGPAGVPANDENLCWLAARHFCREVEVSGNIAVHLIKKIPSEAGLGGGSSDAAAVLKACNLLFDTNLSDNKLEKMGVALGADVPFFIRGGTALGRGIGADLTPLPTLRSGQFLIVKPDIQLKTPDVYGEMKMGLTVNSTKANIRVIKPLLARFPQKTWPGFNRLEEVVLPSQPAVQRLVHRLQELSPVAMLSGSGSAAFAAFDDQEDLSEAVAEFKDAGLFVKVVGPHPAGVELVGVVS